MNDDLTSPPARPTKDMLKLAALVAGLMIGSWLLVKAFEQLL